MSDEIERRIAVLNQFRAALDDLFSAEAETRKARHRGTAPATSDLKSRINRMIPRVDRYMEEVGYAPVMTIQDAPRFGGRVYNLNILHNLFVSDSRTTIDDETYFHFIDRCLGIYEDLLDTGQPIGSRRMASALTVIGALEQKLRPLLKSPPEREREVQDAVEDLFKVLDIGYTREGESFQYSSKNYIPDFVLSSDSVALEIKLCNREGKEKSIVAEINDDIIAYATKFSRSIFVVYDVGLIRDEARFRSDLEANKNVVVLIVKH